MKEFINLSFVFIKSSLGNIYSLAVYIIYLSNIQYQLCVQFCHFNYSPFKHTFTGIPWEYDALPLKDTGIPVSALSSDGTVHLPLASPFPCDTLSTAASEKSGGKSLEVVDTKMCFWKGGQKGTFILLLPPHQFIRQVAEQKQVVITMIKNNYKNNLFSTLNTQGKK